MKRSGLILFIYRDGGVYSRRELRRKLFGSIETRVTRDEYGRVKHKQYSYPGVLTGVWYQRPIPSVIITERRDANKVREVFKKYDVQFIEFGTVYHGGQMEQRVRK